MEAVEEDVRSSRSDRDNSDGQLRSDNPVGVDNSDGASHRSFGTPRGSGAAMGREARNLLEIDTAVFDASLRASIEEVSLCIRPVIYVYIPFVYVYIPLEYVYIPSVYVYIEEVALRTRYAR